jgi:hypothetical protein
MLAARGETQHVESATICVFVQTTARLWVACRGSPDGAYDLAVAQDGE